MCSKLDIFVDKYEKILTDVRCAYVRPMTVNILNREDCLVTKKSWMFRSHKTNFDYIYTYSYIILFVGKETKNVGSDPQNKRTEKRLSSKEAYLPRKKYVHCSIINSFVYNTDGNTAITYILKQKSLATQNLVDILLIIKIPVLTID